MTDRTDTEAEKLAKAALSRGDVNGAIEVLAAAYRAKLECVGAGMTAVDVAGDAVSLAFESAKRHLLEFRGEGTFWAWLRTTARNFALTLIRHHSREIPREDLGDLPAHGAVSEATLACRDELCVFLEHWLTDTEAIVFWYRKVEGRDLVEVGERLRKSKSAVQRIEERVDAEWEEWSWRQKYCRETEMTPQERVAVHWSWFGRMNPNCIAKRLHARIKDVWSWLAHANLGLEQYKSKHGSKGPNEKA